MKQIFSALFCIAESGKKKCTYTCFNTLFK